MNVLSHTRARRTCGILLLPVWLALVTAVADAQGPLKIDFSRGPDDEPLQDGWQPFVGDGVDPITNTFLFEGAPIDLTIEGNTHWRDYRPATGGYAVLSDLLRDGPLCNDVCSLALTLENLADGPYEIRTYFHTTQFGEQDGRPFTPFEIRLTDGEVRDELIADDKLMSDDSSDELSTETIPFRVVGGSPVQILLEKLEGIDHMALPGLELGTPGSLGAPPAIGGGGDGGGGPSIAIDEEGLMIDFTRAPDDEPLQEGWEPFVGDGTDVFTESYSFAGATVDVTIEGNTHWRDYRPATGIFEEYSDLLSDGPLCNAECLMSLRIEGLPDGTYELNTFLHTTQFGPQDGRPFTPFEIRLTDGTVTDAVIAEDKLMSDDTSDELSVETISVNVVGGSPVEVFFDKPGGNDHMSLPGVQLVSGVTGLMPGDADQDWDFDQLDLVKVQIAAKYLTGQPATWGEGDWDGSPGGTQGAPPVGDGVFDQLDIIKALSVGIYLTGPYAAARPDGTAGRAQALVAMDGAVDLIHVPVPEPGSFVMFALGVAFLGGVRRRE